MYFVTIPGVGIHPNKARSLVHSHAFFGGVHVCVCVCVYLLVCVPVSVRPRERRVRCCSPPVVRVFPDVKPRIRNESETMKKKRHIKETLFQTRKRTQPSTCKLKSATASWRHAHPFTGACMCVCVCVHRHQTAMTAARQTSFMQHRGVDVRTGYFHVTRKEAI